MPLVALFVCALTFLSAAASAQTASTPPPVPPGPLTLEQVLALAEARSESIAIARAGISRARADEIRARSGQLPQLSATATYDRAIATEFDNLDFGAEPDPAPDPDPGAEEQDDSTTLPFGRRNTWRVALNFQQNLLNFGRVRALREQAAAGHASADIAMTTARAQLLFDVTQAYYNAALGDRMVAIAEATVSQATATLQQAEAAFSAGTQPEFEVLRARVSRDTQNPTLIRQRVNRDLALLRLKQLLDLPADYDLRLAEGLNDEGMAPPPLFAQRVSAIESAVRSAGVLQMSLETTAPVAQRTAVQEVATAVRLREATLASVKAQRMPNVNFTTNYGRVAYPFGVLPNFNRTNWSLGVNMQLPILTGGRQRGDELAAAAELEQTRVQLQQIGELAALDTRSAWAELIAARAAWEATAGTVEQANRAFELAGVRYQAGVSTQLELSDSRLLLQLAEANRAQAARDLQVARARAALLPELPLGAGATPAQQQFQAPSSPQQQTPQNSGGQIRNASTQGTAQQFGGTQ